MPPPPDKQPSTPPTNDGGPAETQDTPPEESGDAASKKTRSPARRASGDLVEPAKDAPTVVDSSGAFERAGSVLFQERVEGPVPSATEMLRYKEVDESFPARLIDNFILESDHRRSMAVRDQEHVHARQVQQQNHDHEMEREASARRDAALRKGARLTWGILGVLLVGVVGAGFFVKSAWALAALLSGGGVSAVGVLFLQNRFLKKNRELEAGKGPATALPPGGDS